MSQSKTVIVLGAGASREVGLPIGDGLKSPIISSLDIQIDSFGDATSGKLIYEAIKKVSKHQRDEINAYLAASVRIHDALPQATSIDNLIDIHQGNKKIELCAKFAIVKSIMEAERGSTLYFDPSNPNNKPNLAALKDTWYNEFIKLLTQNCHENVIEEKLQSIAFIVFNYDRCLEHFIFHSLQNIYGMDKGRAAQLVKGMAIYHPYGTIGDLPWYGSRHSVGFGDLVNSDNLINLASEIKTFTEGTDASSSSIAEIRDLMLNANVIMFLGFAYHDINLKLLTPIDQSKGNNQAKRIYGTSIDISANNRAVINNQLMSVVKTDSNLLNIRDLSCFQIFNEFSRSLLI